MSGTSPPFTGVPFGRYIIRRRLARGGMGEVFLADQLGPLGPVRPVALKRMLPRVARDPRAAKMFLEEMATAAQLNHPNVATTYDFGEVDGVYFLAMEYVEGLSLRQVVDSLGPLPVADALTITAEIASALDHAHNRRSPGGSTEPVVHRDVSPHNVMISSSGAVKLLDFGIARAEAAVLGGRVEGKLAYAAPEQLRGSPADRRSDLWALGVVLYEILSGAVPFAAADPVGMLEATRSAHRVPLGMRRPEAARVGPIVERAMLDDPDARWPSAEAFGAACRALAAELGGAGAEGRAALVARAGGPRGADSTIGVRSSAGVVGTSTGAAVGVVSSATAEPAGVAPSAKAEPLAVVRGVPARGRARATVAWVVLAAVVVGGGALAIGRRGAPDPAAPDRAAEAHEPDHASAPEVRTTSVAATIVVTTTRDVATHELEEAARGPQQPRRTPRARPRAPGPRERAARSEDAAAEAPTGLGLLSVRTIPWSRVSVDGRELGQSPIVHAPTSAGPHAVLLTPGRGEEPARTLTVHIRAGEVTKVFVDFARDATRIEP